MGMSTTAAEKDFLRMQVHTLQATRVLEIGAFKGETTRVLSEAVAPQDGVVIAIDPMRWASEIIRNGILRHLGINLRAIFASLERWFPLVSYERAFWSQVKAAGHDNVHLFRYLSNDPALLEREHHLLAEFDLVFIDGDHSYEGAKADLDNWGGRVRQGGRVLVHDAIPSFPGVCRAIDACRDNPAVRVHEQRCGSICVIEVL
jgi:predicted O-methyltransferase YrrM